MKKTSLFPGKIMQIEGDSKDLWIKDYNVRVSSPVEILLAPLPQDKKVLVQIAEIDGDRNITTYVRRTKLLPA